MGTYLHGFLQPKSDFGLQTLFLASKKVVAWHLCGCLEVRHLQLHRTYAKTANIKKYRFWNGNSYLQPIRFVNLSAFGKYTLKFSSVINVSAYLYSYSLGSDYHKISSMFFQLKTLNVPI